MSTFKKFQLYKVPSSANHGMINPFQKLYSNKTTHSCIDPKSGKEMGSGIDWFRWGDKTDPDWTGETKFQGIVGDWILWMGC